MCEREERISRRRGGASPITTGVAAAAGREFLRNVDPVLTRLIDAQPDFRPNAWKDELPAFDAFGWLVFQVLGQQLSVRVTRTILSRIEQRFGGRVPSATEVLAADSGVLRASGMSARKVATIRAVADRLVAGRLSDDALASMTDAQVEAVLTEIPGIGPWTARAYLMVALDRPDVLLSGDLALRRAVERMYAVDHLPTDEEMVQVADRWATVPKPRRELSIRVRVRCGDETRPVRTGAAPPAATQKPSHSAASHAQRSYLTRPTDPF